MGIFCHDIFNFEIDGPIYKGTQDEGIIVDEQKNEEKRESVLDISEKKVVAVNREIERSINENKEIERKSISLEGQDDLKFPLRSETGESSSLKENLSQAQRKLILKMLTLRMTWIDCHSSLRRKCGSKQHWKEEIKRNRM